MKPTRDTLVVQGNLTGERTKMSIADEAMEHVMGILTDMYQDPEMAVIREIACNAHDAHVEAGFPGPIEVTLPKPLDPYITIQDFGNGLSSDDIREIYSKYGASTKRDSNEATGMFGIGCKAPLGYVAQFTLSSVKNGEYIAVSVTRDEDGGGSMIVPDTHNTTTERSGTRVQVPAKQQNNFKAKADHFFSFWPEGSVLIDGKPPTRFPGEKVKDDLYIMDANYQPAWQDRYSAHKDSYVVMGNVPYPTRSFSEVGVRLVAFVPIGTVAIPAAREALLDNKRTKEALASIEAGWKRHQDVVFQGEIDKAATPAEAVVTAMKWAKLLKLRFTQGKPIATWRGKDIPEYVLEARPSVLTGNAPTGLRSTTNSTYDLGRSSACSGITPAQMLRGLIVHDFGIQHQADHKRKVRQYIENHATLTNGMNGSRYSTDNDDEGVMEIFLFDGPRPSSEWIPKERLVPYETIRDIKLHPSSQSTYYYGAKAITGSFYVRKPDGGNSTYYTGVEMAAADIAELDPKHVYWIWGGKYEGGREHRELLAIDSGAMLVMVPANRKDKFRRDFPKVENWNDAVIAAERKAIAKTTEAERLAAWIHRHYPEWYTQLRSLKHERIDDPDLRALVLTLQNANITRREVAAITKLVYTHNEAWDGIEWEQPTTKYPLLGGSWAIQDHVYMYIAAVYTAAQKEGE